MIEAGGRILFLVAFFLLRGGLVGDKGLEGLSDSQPVLCKRPQKPLNPADQYGLPGYSRSLWTDAKISGQVFCEGICGGIAGAFIGIHALNNTAGGIGEYPVIFVSDICEDGDWNLTRQGYENLFALTGGNPDWGTKAFYLTDAAIGVGAILQDVPAYQKSGFGVERYYTITDFMKASRPVVAHDVLQISTSIKPGMKK